MGDRVVDCARLESVCTARYRGFESRPIRHQRDAGPDLRYRAGRSRDLPDDTRKFVSYVHGSPPTSVD